MASHKQLCFSHRRRLALLAAEQVVDGHAGNLALDIPESLVDAGERVVEHGAGAPVGADEGGVPDVLDLAGAAPDQEGRQVLVYGERDGARALGEGGAADAGEARDRSLDLHDDQPRAIRRRLDGPHGGDLCAVGSSRRRKRQQSAGRGSQQPARAHERERREREPGRS